MRTLITAIIFSMLCFSLFAQEDAPVVIDANGDEVVIEDASRIITIGGAVTEVAYALGAGDRVIAVDDSSLYPAEALELESIGYLRFLTAEPILALDPTLVIATEDAGPTEVVQQLEESGITFLQVPAEDTVDGAIEKIRTIATALGQPEDGDALVEEMLTDIEKAEELVADVESAPRVLFLFLRGAAVLTVSGTGTGADEMIRLAGGENVVAEYEGYQPLTAEAIIAAEPDIILTTSGGMESVGGMEGLLELPGVAQTPAAENDRIFATMDDLELLGFTPRLGGAVMNLAYQLHPDLPVPTLTYFEQTEGFETFLEGVGIANHAQILGGDGPVTVFVPDETAFETIPAETLESLYSSAISVGFVFSNHYVLQALTLDDLRQMAGETIKPMYFGGNLEISVDADDNVIINDEFMIVEGDIMTANGIIHIIDGVMIPARPN